MKKWKKNAPLRMVVKNLRKNVESPTEGRG